jgi:hypothetical protein
VIAELGQLPHVQIFDHLLTYRRDRAGHVDQSLGSFLRRDDDLFDRPTFLCRDRHRHCQSAHPRKQAEIASANDIHHVPSSHLSLHWSRI